VNFYWNRTELGEWSYHPLGQAWQATSVDFPSLGSSKVSVADGFRPWPLPDGHVHLPYSIEEYCLKLPIRKTEERKQAVLLYAKKSRMSSALLISFLFLRSKKWAMTKRYRRILRWDTPDTLWSDLPKDPEFDVYTTAEVDESGKPIPEGLTQLGKLGRVEYEDLVGSVKAMVGVGFPSISPSVYTAL